MTECKACLSACSPILGPFDSYFWQTMLRHPVEFCVHPAVWGWVWGEGGRREKPCSLSITSEWKAGAWTERQHAISVTFFTFLHLLCSRYVCVMSELLLSARVVLRYCTAQTNLDHGRSGDKFTRTDVFFSTSCAWRLSGPTKHTDTEIPRACTDWQVRMHTHTHVCIAILKHNNILLFRAQRQWQFLPGRNTHGFSFELE